MYRDKVILEMKEVFKEIPYGIDHTMKVLSHAEVIMKHENLTAKEQELIALVAILHDIGAVAALHRYGSIEGVYQEKEGPTVARSILEKVGYNDSISMDRICYIIGNHHTPAKIDGLDFQIQWEADLIENLLGSDVKNDKQKLLDIIDKNFKTAAGKKLACSMLGLEQH